MRIRFVRNFVLFTSEYTIKDGKATHIENQYHIRSGKIYPIESYEEKGALIDITFSNNSNIRGTTYNLNKEYVELLLEPHERKTRLQDCGCEK